MVLLRDQEHRIQVYERRIRDIEMLSVTPTDPSQRNVAQVQNNRCTKQQLIEARKGSAMPTEFQRE